LVGFVEGIRNIGRVHSSGPQFSGKFADLRGLGDVTDFDPTWKRFLLEFRQWSTQFSGQNVSMLHLRLGFLQMLLTHFPSLSALRTDPRIMDLVLAGCRMVGDKIVDPRFGECEIMQRSIGDRFGVLYTLRTSDGSLVSFEFFD
jgi:hypothetical protein